MRGALAAALLMLGACATAPDNDVAREFGAPTCTTADYTIFETASIALRRDPAEILVAIPADFDAITGGC